MRSHSPHSQSPQGFRPWPIVGSFPLLLVLLGMGGFASRGVALNSVLPNTQGQQIAVVEPTIPERALMAQAFTPDPRGMPGRREGGGTRGTLAVMEIPPTALIPATNLGTTLSAHPTLYFYVPAETGGLTAEFMLLDSQGETLYHVSAPLPSQEGIVSVPLPTDLSLESERNYQWFFSVEISENDPSANIILSGWVWRVPENPALMQDIEAIALADQPKAYAEAGLWYDAVTALVNLQQANPGSATVQGQWTTLLESVALQDIASKPLLDALPVTVVTDY